MNSICYEVNCMQFLNYWSACLFLIKLKNYLQKSDWICGWKATFYRADVISNRTLPHTTLCEWIRLNFKHNYVYCFALNILLSDNQIQKLYLQTKIEKLYKFRLRPCFLLISIDFAVIMDAINFRVVNFIKQRFYFQTNYQRALFNFLRCVESEREKRPQKHRQ